MAKIVFDNGCEVELSQETTDRLKEELCKPEGFEKVYDDRRLRLSGVLLDSDDKTHIYPIRLSILQLHEGSITSLLGLPIGQWDVPDYIINRTIPGVILSIRDAEQLSVDLQECIKFVKG